MLQGETTEPLVERPPETVGTSEHGDEVVTQKVEEEALLLDDKGSSHKSSFDTPGLYEWLRSRYSNAHLPLRYRLAEGKNTLKHSIWSVRFAIMASAINTKILNPNYPILVSANAHADSFPDTEPFSFNSATYFLPLCSLLGVAISSTVVGKISDRIGRKRVLLYLAWISAIGSVVKFYSSETFWGFCAAQFAFGFFLGNLPVGMAYIGDIATTKKAKEQELGVLVSFFVMGNSGGGIIAILMEDSGLFYPLWVAAALLVIAALYLGVCMIEAGDFHLVPMQEDVSLDDEQFSRPDTIDKRALWNIIAGAVADNFGSTGLFPLCLSPLALEHYWSDFVSADPPENPVMTLLGYKWLSVMVAAMVIPSTMMTPYVFRVCGVAGTCVLGNVLTALVTLILLLIGNAPPTSLAFGFFVFVMYGGFPFTVFSQLTTGPMLDVLAPENAIGYVQGLNNAAMNFGMAIAPWLFGLLADGTSTNIAIAVGSGISGLAAAINLPLTFDPRFGKGEITPPASQTVHKYEDAEFLEKALAGELVDQEQLTLVNLNRIKAGKPMIIPRVKPYSEEKGEGFHDLRSGANEHFMARIRTIDRILTALDDPESEKTPEEMCAMLNATMYKDRAVMDEESKNLALWIRDYLEDTGYNPHLNSTTIKKMIQTAFPPISFDRDYNPTNLENALLRSRQIFGRYVSETDTEKSYRFTFSETMGTGQAAVFYS